jgi:hypothetical protein
MNKATAAELEFELGSAWLGNLLRLSGALLTVAVTREGRWGFARFRAVRPKPGRCTRVHFIK